MSRCDELRFDFISCSFHQMPNTCNHFAHYLHSKIEIKLKRISASDDALICWNLAIVFFLDFLSDFDIKKAMALVCAIQVRAMKSFISSTFGRVYTHLWSFHFITILSCALTRL